MLGLALRPAAHVVELGAQHQLAGLDGIQVFDHFAAVDLPDQGISSRRSRRSSVIVVSLR